MNCLHQILLIIKPIPGFSSQVEGFKHITDETNTGLSNIKWNYIGPFVENGMVTCFWEWHAKHTGIFMGVKGNGKSLHEYGIDIFKIKNNKIVEMWNTQSAFQVMQQLGVIEFRK